MLFLLAGRYFEGMFLLREGCRVVGLGVAFSRDIVVGAKQVVGRSA